MAITCDLPPQSPAIVALITNDVIGERMAGPGIRYWELARVLERHFTVKLIVPPHLSGESSVPRQDFPAAVHLCESARNLKALTQTSDIIITLGDNLLLYPFLAQLGKYLVVDIYDPYLLSGLARDAQAQMSEQLNNHERYLNLLASQLRSGDFFVCAGEKQRDYWLGALSTAGRVNPYTYQQDPILRRLIDVVPFGLPTYPPKHTRPVLKGVYKSIAQDDKVLLWGGGIWNWFDAPTLIKAMPQILQRRSNVKLFFMGVKRPNSGARMSAVDEAIGLSKKLGLYDKAIFFNDWVPYNERQNYLLEADIGVSLHLNHIETRFAFRTRLLDYLWAALPTVTTCGDVMSETLAHYQLARLINPGDVDGLVKAVLGLLDAPTLKKDLSAQFKKAAKAFSWETVAQPLVEFCAAPYYAPDRAYFQQNQALSGAKRSTPHWALKSWRVLREEGAFGLLKQGKEYLRWEKMMKS
ncbi:MAG: hypothetical protein B6243_05175 [Anaerolineaceae bacterium 4572_5.2]|nr:MAG: hypothetical protein B6243_05175 [Anaerolineaceae bacterium 4572_5.2]